MEQIAYRKGFLITLVFSEQVSRAVFRASCATISVTEMKFPLPKFLLRRRDAKVFAEAGALALLRLEQCIADQYICVPKFDDRLVRWAPAQKRHEPVLNNSGRELEFQC